MTTSKTPWLTVALSALSLAILLAAAPAAQAQATQLSPPADRISDGAIRADQKAYAALQARIKGLNDRGRIVPDYHLSKAQCWLDVSFQEYTRNDRGPFPQAAMTESEKLIVGMEKGSALGNDTPLVGEAVKLRPDLWERAAKLKTGDGLRCAAQKLACAEVELVHAGNEHTQQQWRHAKPYVQIAEDLMGQAETAAANCGPVAPPKVAAVATPAPAPAPRPAAAPVRELALAAHVVFHFDRHRPTDILEQSREQLQTLTERIQQERLEVRTITLIGHADRLNNTGQRDYNQRLSERRVATVRDLLIKQGVDAKHIFIQARGDGDPLTGCDGSFPARTNLQDCLLPNRRVEVQVNAVQKD
jgi:OmpA-OmpF porin, OOP family